MGEVSENVEREGEGGREGERRRILTSPERPPTTEAGLSEVRVSNGLSSRSASISKGFLLIQGCCKRSSAEGREFESRRKAFRSKS
jgi:hypothetical protein